MMTLIRYPSSLIPQYIMIVFFAANGLYEEPPWTPRWWGMVGLLLALSIIILFWPVRRVYVFPYMVVVGAIILALTTIDDEFIFLGFLYAVHVGLLLSQRGFFAWMIGYAVLVEALFLWMYGTAAALFSGLGPILGFVSFGYAYMTKDRIQEAHHETKRLLAELQEAHKKLEAYAAQVQELTLVEERNRLARELHDSVKQQAFAASAQVGAARSLLKTQPQAVDAQLQAAEQRLDEIRSELAQLIYELRPVALEGKGLAAALREWAAGWAAQSGVALNVEITGERPLPALAEQAVFRITQEALSNIHRHSQAARADLRLSYENGLVRLVVQDDGQGFDPQLARSGVGLRSMRERTEQLNDGQFIVKTKPGEGTRIEVHFAG